MPVAAAGLAEIGAGDPQPAEVGGPGEHLLEQLAIAGLAIRSLAQGAAGVRNTDRKRIAHGLQLAKVKRPRPAVDGGNACVELKAGERLCNKRGQLPLETADLAPQLSPSQALISLDSKGRTDV